MNSLLYNISVILLLCGVILLTHYLTRVSYERDVRLVDNSERNLYLSSVYQERPKTLFSPMFMELGPWIGRTVNPTDEELSKETILRTIHI